MKVRVNQNRINSVLSVVISTDDWSRHELDLIVRFGEPTIQIGGKFLKHCTKCIKRHGRRKGRLDRELGMIVRDDLDSGYGTDPGIVELTSQSGDCGCDESNDDDCCFELPEQEKKIRSDMPILVEFGEEDFDDPALCARSWADEIVKRIAKAVDRLRKINSNLVKEEVYEF